MGHGTTFRKTKKTPEEILYFAELFKKYKCQFLCFVYSMFLNTVKNNKYIK